VRTLLPLYRHPADDPDAWASVAGLGSAVTAVVDAGGADPAGLSAWLDALAGAGVTLLGRVDLGRAARPLAEVLAEVRGWSGHPVGGVFLDRAPGDPFGAGPVALALRLARRAGLVATVLNPGGPVDPLYRRLGARLCAFEGDWDAYVGWDGDGARPGDGHLVYGVPAREVPQALRLASARRAGFALVTERDGAHAYTGLPAWCAAAVTRP
jgi:hypothetical protein